MNHGIHRRGGFAQGFSGFAFPLLAFLLTSSLLQRKVMLGKNGPVKVLITVHDGVWSVDRICLCVLYLAQSCIKRVS